MKTFIAIFLALSLIFVSASSFAKKEKKGPQSEKAYEKANENASFKRGDDFETGKSRQKNQNQENESLKKRENNKEIISSDSEEDVESTESQDDNPVNANKKAKGDKSQKMND